MKLAATVARNAATFQLQMALDDALMRERFGEALLAWRTKRGRGDARRFPQGDAARELDGALRDGCSLRTYQSWEAGARMPRRFSTVEEILDYIGSPVSAILEIDEPSSLPEAPAEGGAATLAAILDGIQRLERRMDRLEENRFRAGRDGRSGRRAAGGGG